MENERYNALKDLFEQILPSNYEEIYQDEIYELETKSLEEQNKDKVKYYKSLIERKKEIHKKLSVVRKQMFDALAKIEHFAEENALISILKNAINEGKLIDSSKAIKLSNHDLKPVMTSVKKLNKEMYKLLKSNEHLEVRDDLSIALIYENSAVNSQYNIDKKSLFDKYYLESTFKYRSNYSELGLDSNRFQNLMNALTNKNFSKETVGSELYDKYETLSTLVNDFNISKYAILRENYYSVCMTAKKIWAINEIVELFSKTSIKDSKILLQVMNAKESYVKELSELTKKADKKYKEAHVEETKQKLMELQSLYQHYLAIKDKFYKIKVNDYVEQNKLHRELDIIKGEIKDILTAYPELNIGKYQALLGQIEMVPIFKEGDKKDIKNPIIDENKQVEDSLKTPSEVSQERPVSTVKKEDEKIKLTDYEHALWMEQYQNYMIKKMQQSDLGKIPFSEYLKIVVPKETSLIEKERLRERQAQEIYKEYIRYFAGLSKENKPSALSFREFAMRKYGRNDVEIPMDYEQEYEEMRSQWKR